MSSKHTLSWLCLALYCLPLSALAAFGYHDVVDRAGSLAASAYRKPEPIPDYFREIDYHDYQGIRFDPEKRLWKQGESRFQVMLVPAGLFYTHPVTISIVDSSGVSPLAFDKALFDIADPELEKRVPADLGYAGFKLTYPFDGPGAANQFLVFAGASYFRGVGSENAFGLSARGVAVDTGLASGEEFPSFTEFWLVRPSPGAEAMTVYALLDGPGLTGAYRFVVYPGKTTRVDVTATLFPRRELELAGIAPLTSMFYYGENTPRPAGNWRPEVHDSDGLLVHDAATGEWLWRPLLNPRALQMDYLQVRRPGGFGLLQRDVAFPSYQDLGARYQQRPSTWVEPQGDWGEGNVVLVQLPTPDETNDNIVAFWTPGAKPEPGASAQFGYRLAIGGASIPASPMAFATNTFVGAGDMIGGGDVEDSYRVIVDFAGGPLRDLPGDAGVVAEVTGKQGTEVIEQFVEYNPEAKGWRLSVLAKPDDEKPLALRAYLKRDGRAVSETWAYRLPADGRSRTESPR